MNWKALVTGYISSLVVFVILLLVLKISYAPQITLLLGSLVSGFITARLSKQKDWLSLALLAAAIIFSVIIFRLVIKVSILELGMLANLALTIFGVTVGAFGAKGKNKG